MRRFRFYLTIVLLTIITLETIGQTTYVPDDNFEQALIDLGFDTGALDDYVPTASIDTVTSLFIYNKDINDLTGIEDFVVLTKLNCNVNDLKSIDISSNKALIKLICGSNQLTNLDLSANTALTELVCSSNQLTSLDLSTNTALTFIDCYQNRITSLDLSANTALTRLYCEFNHLTSIDISMNKALTNLYCNVNQLTSLDLSTNTALINLVCDVNQLTSLDLSDNNALQYFNCSSNDLTNLDLSANTALTKLYCGSNQLSSLDVRNGNNENLMHIDASNNSSLACIYVDDKTGAYLSDWTKDTTSNFVNDEADCNTVTLIDEVTAKKGFTLYPNPTNGILKLDFAENNIQKIKIYDITGKTVFEKVNIEQNEIFDLSGFANGIYIVILQTENESLSSRIIKE